MKKSQQRHKARRQLRKAHLDVWLRSQGDKTVGELRRKFHIEVNKIAERVHEADR